MVRGRAQHLRRLPPQRGEERLLGGRHRGSRAGEQPPAARRQAQGVGAAVAWVAKLPFPEFEQDYEFVALRDPEAYAIEDGRLAFDTAKGRLGFDSVYPALGSRVRSDLAAEAGAMIGVLSLDDLLRVAGDELGEIARAVRGTRHSHIILP